MTDQELKEEAQKLIRRFDNMRIVGSRGEWSGNARQGFMFNPQQGGGSAGGGGVTPATGACCFPDGTCSVETLGQCLLDGGIYQGDGTTCTPNPCSSCCACPVTFEVDTIEFGSYGLDCGFPGCINTPDGTLSCSPSGCSVSGCSNTFDINLCCGGISGTVGSVTFEFSLSCVGTTWDLVMTTSFSLVCPVGCGSGGGSTFSGGDTFHTAISNCDPAGDYSLSFLDSGNNSYMAHVVITSA